MLACWSSGHTVLGAHTPSISAQYAKEFAVVASRVGASVIIRLKAAVTFQDTFYAAGGDTSVTLQPQEGVQLQSTGESRVTPSSPVALFSGHSCAHKHTNRHHVAKKLLPICAWGTHYVVTPCSGLPVRL